MTEMILNVDILKHEFRKIIGDTDTNTVELLDTAILGATVLDKSFIAIKCEWITCKFNSERGKNAEGQEGDCQFVGTIKLKEPVFDNPEEDDCDFYIEEMIVCAQFQPDPVYHPTVKASWSIPE
jgi:hypothetical protein